jgi:hypothetical protein
MLGPRVMICLAAGVLALAGCFDPGYSDQTTCGPAGECPRGRTCRTGRCVLADAPLAPLADGPGAPDAVPADARTSVTIALMKQRPLGGDGTLTSNVGGLACGTGCDTINTSVKTGNPVSVSVVPTQKTLFTGWRQPAECAGSLSRTCTFSASADTTVVASFTPHDRNVAFVTSASWGGALGGQDGASSKCNQAASDVNLDGIYVAALAMGDKPVSDLLVINGSSPPSQPLGWMRLDGLEVAPNVTYLTTLHALTYPVLYDEHGNPHLGLVWTGADENGNPGGNIDCHGFSDTSGVGAVGHSGGGGSIWAYGLNSCVQSASLLCLEVSKPNQVQHTAGTLGLYIYLSKALFHPSDGAAAADAICNAERPEGVGNALRALIASPGRPAAAILRAGATYARPDGVRVGTAEDIIAGKLESGIWVYSDGTYAGDVVVWTGSASIAADGTSSCNGWTVSTGAGTVGAPVVGPTFWAKPSPLACSVAQPVYCAETVAQ